jgi:putative DNA primase/helicase
MLRRMLAYCQEISGVCMQHNNSDSVADILAFAESKIYEISKSNGCRSLLNLERIIPDIGEFLKIQPPPRRTYLDPWLKEASINLITGWRGIGKTAFTLGLLNATSKGESFGPWGAEHAVPCLYFDAEMTQQDLKERCEELYDQGKQREKLYIFSDHLCSLMGMPVASLLDEKWRRWMKEEVLLRLGVELWVLDNIGSVTPGLDENSREAWSPINRWLLDLRFAGISTILLHHEGKSGTQRGTSAREDNLDISISLKKPADYRPEDGARFIVHFEKARVPQQYLHLISDTEFKQEIGAEGKVVWTFSSLKVENRVKVLTMLDEGILSKEIAELVGISKGRVSQIKAEAIKEGLLTDKGKLTQNGVLYVQGG